MIGSPTCQALLNATAFEEELSKMKVRAVSVKVRVLWSDIGCDIP